MKTLTVYVSESTTEYLEGHRKMIEVSLAKLELAVASLRAGHHPECEDPQCPVEHDIRVIQRSMAGFEATDRFLADVVATWRSVPAKAVED